LASSSINQELDVGNLLYGDGLYNGGSISSAPVSAGQIAIGTSTPYSRFTVWDSGTGTGQAFEVVNNASTTLARILDSGKAYFSGNVGIGTTSPASRLTVWGLDSGATTSAFAVVNNSSTTVFSVFDNGNATYYGSIFQSSDQRLKTDVTSLDASDSLAAIEELNPVSYLRIDQPGTGDNLGFIAQQVQTIFPELVSTTSPTSLTPDGTLTLNYEGLIAPIVNAIQAIASEISSIENTIAGFAQGFTTHQLNADELCIDGTCIDQQQLAALLASANQSSAGGSSQLAEDGASTTPDTPPIIQINGDNPAIVQVGATYSDLGAQITGPQADLNLGIQTYVNGIEMSPVQIDTSAAATDTIDYVATDQNGLTATTTRTVIVEAANDNDQPPANDNELATSSTAL
jgi:hypothetical protein